MKENKRSDPKEYKQMAVDVMKLSISERIVKEK